ncbi:UNKNOWN [Stylonychia lemnae]|uniref:Uncharacterized protein n=1 Tax=Stylonychia lemnae TaxID=5949 RepID=A0A078A2R2_STYLE|nr:UNKNOWN [Stylonychia lemnae]|eukprot:CDW76385.1 UNKNOWN [Stylonychia lemnae]
MSHLYEWYEAENNYICFAKTESEFYSNCYNKISFNLRDSVKFIWITKNQFEDGKGSCNKLSYADQTFKSLKMLVLNQGKPYTDICYDSSLPDIPFGYAIGGDIPQSQNLSLYQIDASIQQFIAGVDCRIDGQKYTTLTSKKSVVKKKGVYVTLPTKKLLVLSILSIMQFLALMNGIVFFLTDILFFHIGFSWQMKCLRNRLHMTFIDLFNGIVLIVFYSLEFVLNFLLHNESIRPNEPQKVCIVSSMNVIKSNIVFLLLPIVWYIRLHQINPQKYFIHQRNQKRYKNNNALQLAEFDDIKTCSTRATTVPTSEPADPPEIIN